VGLCLAGGLVAWFSFFGYAGFLSDLRLTGAVQAEKNIAVLPFESLSDNKNDSYFADGVQDEILANVARISQLKVISRTSVMQYRTDTKRDLRQIANALGVVNVLEGTVRRAANHVRITTELIDAINDRTTWSEIYDRDLSDIFAIQSEVAQTVADKLAATLSPEEKKNIEAIPTENLEAYDLYLQAKERRNYAGVFPLNGPGSPANAEGTQMISHRSLARFLLWRFLSASYDPLYETQGSCRPYLETGQDLYLTSPHMRHFLRRRSGDAEPMGGGRFA
jgi:TolB-like protein